MRERLEDHLNEYLTLRTVSANGPTREKVVPALSDAQLSSSYASLGTASGATVGQVLHIAFRHCNGFFDRVAGYRQCISAEAQVIEQATGQPSFSVEFFERDSA